MCKESIFDIFSERFFSISGISLEFVVGLFKNSYDSFSSRVHKLETKLNMVQSLNFEQLQLNHFSKTTPASWTNNIHKKYFSEAAALSKNINKI